MQLRYAITLFLRKMGHRWGLRSQEVLPTLTPIGNAQRYFPKPHFEPPLNCISDFRPPSQMKFKYLAAYAVRGVTIPPGMEEVALVHDEEMSATVTLTKDINARSAIFDRQIALAEGMLSAYWRNEPGGTELGMNRTIERIRTERAANIGGDLVIAIEAEGDISGQVPVQAHRLHDFIVCFHAADRNMVKQEFKGFNERMISAVSLSLPECMGTRKLTEGVYLLDDDGTVVHSYDAAFGTPGVNVSGVVNNEALDRIEELITKMPKNKALESVVRLLGDSLNESAEPLARFVSAWTSLELLVHKSFAALQDGFMADIAGKAGTSGATRFVNRVQVVMKGKYTLVDEFGVISTMLEEDTAAALDVDEFKRLKAIRDRYFHGEDTVIETLPTQEARRLAMKYLRLFLGRR